MRIHYLSDIHLEFGRWPKKLDVNAIDADVTVLAGDIGVGLQGLDFALTFERPVVYVAGNHEFYGQRTVAKWWEKARKKVAGTHVHLLENEEVTIGDMRFLGATLWTDYELFGPESKTEAMEEADRAMTDFQRIFLTRRGSAQFVSDLLEMRRSGDLLTPEIALAFHRESRAFLEQRLAKRSARKMVVVSHHAPSAASLDPEEAPYLDSASYASHLDALIEQCDLWVHGHTHSPVDYRRGCGRVVSNSRGYVGEAPVPEFEWNRVVEI